MVIDAESQKLLTINTHKGLFWCKRLLYGVSLASVLWQRSILQVLQGLAGVQYILDAMLITGTTETEHLHNIRSVLKHLREFGLKLNKKLCV